jgi:hypothetical protein
VTYTVVWAPDAEKELARLWNDAASDRQAISDASDFLDRSLARNPVGFGESRPSGVRIAHCLPLGIRFAVSENDRVVRVVAVWLVRSLNK